jgi:hypothetical protein
MKRMALIAILLCAVVVATSGAGVVMAQQPTSAPQRGHSPIYRFDVGDASGKLTGTIIINTADARRPMYVLDAHGGAPNAQYYLYYLTSGVKYVGAEAATEHGDVHMGGAWTKPTADLQANPTFTLSTHSPGSTSNEPLAAKLTRMLISSKTSGAITQHNWLLSASGSTGNIIGYTLYFQYYDEHNVANYFVSTTELNATDAAFGGRTFTSESVVSHPEIGASYVVKLVVWDNHGGIAKETRSLEPTAILTRQLVSAKPVPNFPELQTATFRVDANQSTSWDPTNTTYKLTAEQPNATGAVHTVTLYKGNESRLGGAEYTGIIAYNFNTGKYEGIDTWNVTLTVTDDAGVSSSVTHIDKLSAAATVSQSSWKDPSWGDYIATHYPVVGSRIVDQSTSTGWISKYEVDSSLTTVGGNRGNTVWPSTYQAPLPQVSYMPLTNGWKTPWYNYGITYHLYPNARITVSDDLGNSNTIEMSW